MNEQKEMPQGRARGGVARARALTANERRESAKRAAEARWSDGVRNLPVANYTGSIRIGDADVPCAVLDDERRVLTQLGFLRAIGRGRPAGGASQGTAGEGLPAFLVSDNLKPFISSELRRASTPIVFKSPKGGGKGGNRAFGYAAELLPGVCNVYLEARRQNKLLPQQRHVADACEIILTGLAENGIIGLVDEATGYQEHRAKDALQEIFNAFLRKTLAAWTQRFPEEFYRQIARLRGWPWKGMKVNRPQVVAYYTIDIVYSRLLPGIVDELESRMPRNKKGMKKGALHQLLTADIGHPALAQHLHAVITLMRVADDNEWDEFMRMLNKAHPKQSEVLLIQALQSSSFQGEKRVNVPIESLPLFARLDAAHQV